MDPQQELHVYTEDGISTDFLSALHKDHLDRYHSPTRGRGWNTAQHLGICALKEGRGACRATRCGAVCAGVRFVCVCMCVLRASLL